MLYQVETKALNRAVKRNIKRFPEDFCFQLTTEEAESLKCQSGISKIQEQEKLTKTIIDKIVDIKQDLLQNRDCANLIPKVENIEDICREMLK